MIPLLKFTNSKVTMGERANSRLMNMLCSGLAGVVVVANVALIVTTIFSADMSTGLRVLVGILVAVGFAFYFALLFWLIRRPLSLTGNPADLLPRGGDGEDVDVELDRMELQRRSSQGAPLLDEDDDAFDDDGDVDDDKKDIAEHHNAANGIALPNGDDDDGALRGADGFSILSDEVDTMPILPSR